MKVVSSSIDRTLKFVFDGGIEYSFIDKNDGKDIVCLPSQTSCNLGCTFCHLTGNGKQTKHIEVEETMEHVNSIMEYLKENRVEDKNNTILFSFMGAGEALLSVEKTVARMSALYDWGREVGEYETVRFGIASIVPTIKAMDKLRRMTGRFDVKFHYSLHDPSDTKRSEIVPNAHKETDMVLERLRLWKRREIHYTPIYGVNDSKENAELLAERVSGKAPGTTVKLIKMATKDEMTGDTESFANHLMAKGIDVEQYSPPGSDIGAACGQFNIDEDDYNDNSTQVELTTIKEPVALAS